MTAKTKAEVNDLLARTIFGDDYATTLPAPACIYCKSTRGHLIPVSFPTGYEPTDAERKQVTHSDAANCAYANRITR